MDCKAIKLEKFGRSKCCVLCNGKETDEITFGSIYKLDKIEVHYFCLLLSSIVVQKGEDEEGILGFLPNDILHASQELSKVKCTYCGAEGANVRCSAIRCRVIFHYPCGIKNNSFHKFSGKFLSFCSKHRSQQRIPKNVLELIKTAQLECIVCLESVELDTNMIWAPCCKKSALFHRRCLQRLAISFGSYALKCPLCNNKKKFCNALLENGIFIPEQDASWEAEPNAFSELVQRHNHCDAANCVSPRGRQFSQNFVSSMWKIILCSDCGSQGIHKACLRLTSGGRSHLHWRCDVCRSTERTPSDQPTTAIDSYTVSDSNPESEVEVVACNGIQGASASSSTSTLIIPNGNHQLASSTVTVKDKHNQPDKAQQDDFQLNPILIIDSDDEKDSIICIDSDESDDEVVEIASEDPEIEITVIQRGNARRSNGFPLIGRVGGAGNRIKYINVCPHRNMICPYQVPNPPANCYTQPNLSHRSVHK